MRRVLDCLESMLVDKLDHGWHVAGKSSKIHWHDRPAAQRDAPFGMFEFDCSCPFFHVDENDLRTEITKIRRRRSKNETRYDHFVTGILTRIYDGILLYSAFNQITLRKCTAKWK